MLNNSPMKFNVPGKLVVPRINRNNEVENTGYMLNLLAWRSVFVSVLFNHMLVEIISLSVLVL